jgi:tRNA-splicing ligase RtcB
MPQHLSKKLISWASILEDNTRQQAETTATMPFIYPHVALMPDAHLGKGATVGSVLPTDHAIIPAAVGVDIGCGMLAVRTQFTRFDLEFVNPLPDLHESISRRVPLSAGRYNTKVQPTAEPRIEELTEIADGRRSSPSALRPNWPLQLGSLGSGNHFIEVSLDEEDRVWLFLHSGSRGVGNKIAQAHQGRPGRVKKWWIDLPDPDLAYLVEGTDEFWTYIRELRWAQRFAWLNREEMMDRVVEAVERHGSARRGRAPGDDQLPPQLHGQGEALR